MSRKSNAALQEGGDHAQAIPQRGKRHASGVNVPYERAHAGEQELPKGTGECQTTTE
jgi:hypothetical protein